MVNKQEIEEAIRGKDDFIKIDYLNRYLRKADNLDLKKFILLSLASVNEQKGLLYEAIKNVENAGNISVTFREKRDLYMKETELLIRNNQFDLAEKALHKAYGYGNTQERREMEIRNLEYYRAHGKTEYDKGRHRKAIEVYEKLLSITKSTSMKQEAKEKLLGLYEKTGKLRDFYRLREVEFQ